MPEVEHTLAVFIDFENLALGFKGKRDRRFEIQKVLERLVEKGKLIVKKAYADWIDYAEYKKGLHEAAIELIEIPKRAMTGKNSADIRLCVDAIDLCYSKEHIDTFVVVSGDSDFSPLVSKLKENGKRVIGLGMKESSSNLLVNNCDEFIYYEDLERPLGIPPKIEQDLPEKKKEAFQLLVDSVVALVRENKEVLWSSMVKETMKRKKPSFNESYHGYRTFSDLLEDAEKAGVIQLRTDTRSGTYVIVGFGKEQKKESEEDLKESKEQKERKPSKPRWRLTPKETETSCIFTSSGAYGYSCCSGNRTDRLIYGVLSKASFFHFHPYFFYRHLRTQYLNRSKGPRRTRERACHLGCLCRPGKNRGPRYDLPFLQSVQRPPFPSCCQPGHRPGAAIQRSFVFRNGFLGIYRRS